MRLRLVALAFLADNANLAREHLKDVKTVKKRVAH
jgi:hypothetical protein